VDPPLDHPGLDQVAGRDLACEPGEPPRLPVPIGEEAEVGEEGIGRLPPADEQIADRHPGSPLHDPVVEGLDRERLSVEAGPVVIELLRRVSLGELRRRSVVRGEVGHHVTVPPSRERARLLPRLGIGVLDGPAEPLALGVRDPEQRGAVQAHGAESYSTGRAHLGPRYRHAGSFPLMGAIDRFTEAARRMGVEPRIRRFPDGTRTAADAARAIGCDVAQIVKSLVFMVDDRPVIAFTSGANRVDASKLATVAGAAVARKATPEEARAATGFAVGGTPPFGHPTPLPTYLDPDLLAFQEVWAAAGTPDSVFPLAPSELFRAAGAETASFIER
jgi:prolyl-tRNA editing enzyme YbaK/EbsC (Cys-tRNA(Pro) deacylase)